MPRFIFIILISLLTFKGFSQELNCQVSINSQKVNGSEQKVFQTLQTAIYEMMNQTKWTSYKYKVEERIECSILITIGDWNQNDIFKGTCQVQSRRPIYNTSYNSVMLNYLDKDFNFTYTEGTPLEFQLSGHTSNLTSMLAFYAYMILGLDFDSYQKYGGTIFFQNAQTIKNNAQSATESGWKAFESNKNRYWFVENILNTSFTEIRDIFYDYHRLGFDVMYDKLELGRAKITSCLDVLKQLKREEPNLYILTLFMEAKRDELVNLYKEASPTDKPKVIAILKEIDPTHSADYQKISAN